MSLLEKLKKSSKLARTDILQDSDIFNDIVITPTSVPMLNVALGGAFDGGISSGCTLLAGPSKHFKTSFALLMAASYMKAHAESVLMFYDSEFGTPQKYFDSFGIDRARVLHIPIMNIEELKFDLVNQLEVIEKKDNVIIIVDSIGNLASKKELEDAMNEKSVADMTRAKALKGLFRMITPYLQLKAIPMFAINHTYKEQCMAGDTRIKTDRGILPISEIETGDCVYALTGLQKVLAVYGPDDLDSSGKRFLELEFDDGSTVRCTHDHMFLDSNNEWTRAIDLKIGSEMR